MTHDYMYGDQLVSDCVDSEKIILAGIILNNACLPEVEDLELEPAEFFLAAHQRLFAAMLELHAENTPVNHPTVTERLQQHNELDSVGGEAFLSDLIDGACKRPSLRTFALRVKEAARRRSFGIETERASLLSRDPTVSMAALCEEGRELSEIVRGGDARPPRFSEEALALRFSRQHAEDLRYVADWGCWMCWDGHRWRKDSTLAVLDHCRAVCRVASSGCGYDRSRDAVRLASKGTAAAIERLAQADRCHAATTEQWDSNPWLLNTPKGTINLLTGELAQHQREQYLTKLAAAGPGSDCPTFLAFLDRVTDGNLELQSFLQRVVGYCLTGVTTEHALFFCYGTGANGKSVFLSTIAGLLGDYARTTPASTFTVSNTEQHPTDLAGLRAARFVMAIETEDGRCWAEAKIKSLTGGDRIAARFMRQDFFEYVPQFKLVVAGNHKPGLRNTDEAMRRRIHMIPFAVTIPESERDHELSDKLRTEYPGILQWAIAGCSAWQLEGLNPPAIVREATEGYLAAEDTLGRWIEECCTIAPGAWTAGADLFAGWRKWCQQAGEFVGSRKRFAQQMETHGFSHSRTGQARGFTGVGLREDAVTHMTGSSISDAPRACELHKEEGVISVTDEHSVPSVPEMPPGESRLLRDWRQ